MPPRRCFVHILTNERHTVLYTGVTTDIRRRLTEHWSGRGSVCCRKYDVSKSVYLEAFEDVNEAIAREKHLKSGSRRQKRELIAVQNPTWRVLATDPVALRA